jgi:ubiquitin-protein ligase
MSAINLIVKYKETNEELDIEVDDAERVGQVADFLRKELQLRETDAKGRVKYNLVRNGLKLVPDQSLREAGVRNQDNLVFLAEYEAAAARDALLRNEYNEVLRRFRDHARVKIAVTGKPPTVYKVTYHLRGLVGRAGGELQFADRHEVTITVPQDYPHSQPQARMETPAYHPNIALPGGRVCIGDDYFTSTGIADVIARVGNYLQYREVGLAKPYPQEPADWVRSNGGKVGPFDSVPLDEVG